MSSPQFIRLSGLFCRLFLMAETCAGLTKAGGLTKHTVELSHMLLHSDKGSTHLKHGPLNLLKWLIYISDVLVDNLLQ